MASESISLASLSSVEIYSFFPSKMSSGGIGLGIAVAVFDYVWTSANVSSVVPVARRSLTLWSPQQRTYIENHVYNAQHPKIVTLECRGSVFFGSSMQFLSSILDKICINPSVEEKAEINVVNSPVPNRVRHSVNSPLPSASSSPTDGYLQERRRERAEENFKRKARSAPRAPPRFLVLDLSSVSNIDASAARGCFLQLAKICAAREIVVCAAGANSRIDWIMQTHDAAQHVADGLASGSLRSNEKIILFNDFDEGERRLLFSKLRF
jgi:MFS superfamily sulfate permease-like transporter